MATPYLSLVSIAYRFDDDLIGTLRSIDAQSVTDFQNVVVISKITESEKKDLLSEFSRSGRKFIIGEDSSLYNAMNLGLKSSIGTHVLFLNSGDFFLNQKSLEKVVRSLNLNRNLSFSVCFTWGDLEFVKPTERAHLCRNFPHPGFVANIHEEKIPFNESRLIDADFIWMQEYQDLYCVDSFKDVISVFTLGGVSNYPTFKSIKVRFSNQGYVRGFEEIARFLTRVLFGTKNYYLLVNKFYPKINQFIQRRFRNVSGRKI